MKNTKHMAKQISTLLIGIGLLTIISCSQNPVGGNEAQELQGTLKRGIPAEEMNFISWNPEIREKLATRALKGEQTKEIKSYEGGKVGSGSTLKNKVVIPEGAFSADVLASYDNGDEDEDWKVKVPITVRVLNLESGKQIAAGVDFLPSQHFEKAVKVTLSWAFLETSEGVDFTPYFSENDGDLWYEVGDENYEIDYDKKTISFYVDHFTRFSWGTM